MSILIFFDIIFSIAYYSVYPYNFLYSIWVVYYRTKISSYNLKLAIILTQ